MSIKKRKEETFIRLNGDQMYSTGDDEVDDPL